MSPRPTDRASAGVPRLHILDGTRFPVNSRVWLRANPRPALLLALPTLLLGLASVALARWTLQPAGFASAAGQLVGGLVAGIGLAAMLVSTRPRLALVGSTLRLRVRWFGVEKAPLSAVEGFLLGTGELPLAVAGRPVEAATLVIKLADAAVELADRPTNRMLAQWCDHYVRIRGVFCEPLDLRLVERLNERLAVAKGVRPKVAP